MGRRVFFIIFLPWLPGALERTFSIPFAGISPGGCVATGPGDLGVSSAVLEFFGKNGDPLHDIRAFRAGS